MKTTVDRAHCPFVRDELVSKFFEHQLRQSDPVLKPVLEVDEEPESPTRWSILLRVHLGETLPTSFCRRRVKNTPPSPKTKGELDGVAAYPG